MEVTAALLYLIIAIVSVALYFVKRNLNYWKDQGIPHEEPHLLMGNFRGVRTKYQIGEIIGNYYKKFKGTGPFAGIHIVQRPGVVLLDKGLIKNVLIKDFNNFVNRGMYYNEKNDPLTGNLFFMDGQLWRVLRNKLSPTFTSGKMKYMYPTVLNVAEKFMQVLKEKVNEDPIVDVRDMLGRFTTDVISSVAFGIEVNSLRNPNSDFPRLGRKLTEQPRHNALIMAFIDGFPNLSRKLGMRIVPEDVHQFFMKTIKDTIAYREKNQIERNDFMKLLLDIKNNKELSGLTIEEMCAQVFVFFLGGFETSSSTMSFALFELALNTHLQDRLREEVNEAYDKQQGFNYECLKNMTYLDQVLSETLRKYPIVPQLNRQAAQDYAVPGHPEYVIKKGMPVLIPVLGIHHDPEFYPNPQEFDPERFDPEVAKQRDPMEYLPFGDGPRNCIGERFGKMQSHLGLANLIRNFRFSTCSKTEVPIKLDPKAVTYSPKNTIYLKVEAI
uniref:CYP6A28 n=1 Tax=Lucilia cuprina TaxID=7375 RepID=A9X928_LUCCU|nr:CYP6A28 [Lucilia cuprina]